MYLKIEIEGEEEFYSFENKKIVTIGRAPECDVQLLVEGVSRDHLLIMETDEGDFKFIDLGSTNGTYVNGQLIEKDVETDFNSFFPVKLGSQVYVYLIDEVTANAIQNEYAEREKEEEKEKSSLEFPTGAQDEPESEPESEEDLKKRKRKQLQDRVYVPKSRPTVTDHETTKVFKRPTLAVASSSENKRKKKAPKVINLFLGLLAGIGIAYYFSPKEKEVVKTSLKENVSHEPIAPKKKVVERSLEEKMMGIVGLDKCLGETEALLCSELKKVRVLSNKEGFLKFASKLYLVVRLESIASAYENYKLGPTEQARLLKAMAINLGRQFSEKKIRNNNLVFQKPDLNSDLAKQSALFIDLAVSKAFKKIKSIDEINEVTVILTNNNKFVHSAILGPKVFSELEKKKLSTDLLYYWRSGLSRPLAQYFAGPEGKELISLVHKNYKQLHNNGDM